MPALSKLNLSRAVRITDSPNREPPPLPPPPAEGENPNSDPSSIVPESVSSLPDDDNDDAVVSYLDDNNDGLYVNEQLLSPSNYPPDDTNVDQSFCSDLDSDAKSYQTIPSPRNDAVSIKSDFSETSNHLNQIDQNSSLPLLAPPPIPVTKRERFRTVNKIDKDPTTLPLRELLFYNPPETVYQKELRESNADPLAEPDKPVKIRRRSSRASSVSSQRSSTNNNNETAIAIAEESNDLVENTSSIDPNDTVPAAEPAEETLAIDESGNIVIKNPGKQASDAEQVVVAKPKSSTTYNSFRRKKSKKQNWNTEETGIFYTALEIVGTNFSLMEAVFFKDRGRDRKELKQKFKREEKFNRAYLDEVLYKSLHNRNKNMVIPSPGDGVKDDDDDDKEETATVRN